VTDLGKDDTNTNPSAEIFLPPKWDKYQELADASWSSRGWTMQEGLLSRRLLYYTSSQMIWKCCEGEQFESGVTVSLAAEIKEVAERYSDDIYSGSEWFWKLDTFIGFKGLSDYLTSPLYSYLRSHPHHI
jgi:hypothetical protein